MSNAKLKPAFDPSKIKVVKNVTLPVLKLVENETVYVRIDTAMKVSKAQKPENAKAGKGAEMEKPATVVEVTDLQTGENAVLIVSSVLEGNLNEHYAGGGYVGKSFSITKKAKRAGKRYNDYVIQEIDA